MHRRQCVGTLLRSLEESNGYRRWASVGSMTYESPFTCGTIVAPPDDFWSVRRFEDALNRNFEDLFKLSSSRKAD